MKKKKLIIIGVVLFVTIIVAVITINQVSKWSEMSFEAIVQETVTQSDGEIRLIVERTTEIYGSPFNSLLISDSTKLVDEEDNIISITDFSRGDTVMVVLKDSFDEELIFYYPTVYQVTNGEYASAIRSFKHNLDIQKIHINFDIKDTIERPNDI